MTADLAVLAAWTGILCMAAGLGTILAPYAERLTRGWFGHTTDTPIAPSNVDRFDGDTIGDAR